MTHWPIVDILLMCDISNMVPVHRFRFFKFNFPEFKFITEPFFPLPPLPEAVRKLEGVGVLGFLGCTPYA